MSSPPSKYPTAGPSAPMTYMMAGEREGKGQIATLHKTVYDTDVFCGYLLKHSC